MDRVWAQEFCEGWVEAWNAHDLEQVLSHFSDDVVFASPVAAQLLGDSDGVIRGKAALRQYWSEALRLIPDLHFEVLGVYEGVNTLVINYRNQKGALVSEVLTFEGHTATHGLGCYMMREDSNPAGAGTSRS
jgi:ketosteroid isomerase-like protein